MGIDIKGEKSPAGTLVVTSSWDDGHQLDVRLADLLVASGVAGTFYVAPDNRELERGQRLSPPAISHLAERFEIGAHTLTHCRLPALAPDAARREIEAGRDALEHIIGRQVTSFCYPGGAFRPEHVGMVADAGFDYARTVERFSCAVPTNWLRAATTVHAYRHLVDGPAAVRLARSGPLARPAWRLWRQWDALAITLFDRAMTTGGVYHLWGHSWEIHRDGGWRRLERVLRHVGGRPGVRYMTNGELRARAVSG